MNRLAVVVHLGEEVVESEDHDPGSVGGAHHRVGLATTYRVSNIPRLISCYN